MFTARSFLEIPPGPGKYNDLLAKLRTDPIRLRQEFLVIATNPNEEFLMRERALRILHLHGDELGVRGSPVAIEEMLKAFANEFPPKTLERIAPAMRDAQSQTHEKARAETDGFVAHLFCVIFADLAPERTKGQINAVKDALKGTLFEEVLS